MSGLRSCASHARTPRAKGIILSYLLSPSASILSPSRTMLTISLRHSSERIRAAFMFTCERKVSRIITLRFVFVSQWNADGLCESISSFVQRKFRTLSMMFVRPRSCAGPRKYPCLSNNVMVLISCHTALPLPFNSKRNRAPFVCPPYAPHRWRMTQAKLRVSPSWLQYSAT